MIMTLLILLAFKSTSLSKVSMLNSKYWPGGIYGLDSLLYGLNIKMYPKKSFYTNF